MTRTREDIQSIGHKTGRAASEERLAKELAESIRRQAQLDSEKRRRKVIGDVGKQQMRLVRSRALSEAKQLADQAQRALADAEESRHQAEQARDCQRAARESAESELRQEEEALASAQRARKEAADLERRRLEESARDAQNRAKQLQKLEAAMARAMAESDEITERLNSLKAQLQELRDADLRTRTAVVQWS